MSMALVNDVQQIKAKVESLLASVLAVKADNAKLANLVEEMADERREQRKAIAKLEERMARFDALEQAIHRDAVEILNRTRERIDPTKVKMPYPLKALGYGVAR
jgi:hypothetical protein